MRSPILSSTSERTSGEAFDHPGKALRAAATVDGAGFSVTVPRMPRRSQIHPGIPVSFMRRETHILPRSCLYRAFAKPSGQFVSLGE